MLLTNVIFSPGWLEANLTQFNPTYPKLLLTLTFHNYQCDQHYEQCHNHIFAVHLAALDVVFAEKTPNTEILDQRTSEDNT